MTAKRKLILPTVAESHMSTLQISRKARPTVALFVYFTHKTDSGAICVLYPDQTLKKGKKRHCSDVTLTRDSITETCAAHEKGKR